MEQELYPVSCFSEPGLCVIKPVCRLRDVLAEALAAYLDSLEKYTLQDLLEPRKELGRLLLLEDSAGARA